MRKILFFDCWTKGVEHLISLINDALPKDKFQVKLLHFESIYTPGFPKFKRIKNLDCYDYTFHRTFNIKKIFQTEKPDLVIFFDKGSLLDRAGIKAAKSLKIPTLYIQHGLLPFVRDEESFYQNIYSPNFYLKNVLRIFKMARIYLETSLAVDKFFLFRPKTYCLLFHLLTNPHKFYFTYPDEVRLDKLVVYGQVDKEFFQKKDGYKDEEIEITGSPFLDKTCLLAKKIKKVKNEKPIVILLTKPYIEDHQFGWDERLREKVVREIYGTVTRQGMELCLKLHPRENIKDYQVIFKRGEKVKIFKNTDLDEVIVKSDLVLSFYSTSLYNVIVLGKPLILINWIKGTPLTFDFSKFGVARRADTLGELEELLKNFRQGKFFEKNYSQKKEEFIKEFLYKDDGKAMDRIAKLIEKITS